MGKKPFLIDAVLGDGQMLVTLTRDAEIQRIFWPHVDGGQHVERLLGGVSLDGRPVVWQNQARWRCEQGYEPDQNVLVTAARLGSRLAVRYLDAVVPGRSLLVRHLTFTNTSRSAVTLRYLLYQHLRLDEHPYQNTALFDEVGDSLVGYRQDRYVAAGADRQIEACMVGRSGGLLAKAARLEFGDCRILHEDPAAVGVWDIGRLAPGESQGLTLYMAFGESLGSVRAKLAAARAEGAGALVEATRAYWRTWLGQARPLVGLAEPPGRAEAPVLPGIPAGPASPAELEALYRRSLLVFALMTDRETGAVIAAPEFDPGFTASGGYAYCWGRDAGYFAVAMDLAGFSDVAERFYRWAIRAQEGEGWWMHRHDTAGRWGPSWGLIQADETGTMLYGMALHARIHGGEAFAREVWPSARRAAAWLLSDIDPETGLPLPSVDLWEERTSEHTYSSASVCAGLRAAAELALLAGADGAPFERAAEELRASILRECVRSGVFVRGRRLKLKTADEQDVDPALDLSLLGLVTPFGVVAPSDPVMTETARQLTERLWHAPAGGMGRYEGDRYRGGNPWILCTLWLGLWEAERGDAARARQLLDWAVARQNGNGLLAEQVDGRTGAPVWVVPLTWSHAMYVLLMLKLYGGAEPGRHRAKHGATTAETPAAEAGEAAAAEQAAKDRQA